MRIVRRGFQVIRAVGQRAVRWGRIGFVALVVTLLFPAAGCRTESGPSGPDVLLVILDTTRADHLSSYGYPRETTPNLDRLAAEGERYEEAYAQAPWTLPAMASILTGLPPHAHGAGRTAEGVFGILPEVRPLAQRLAAVGYRTAAFINVVWCSPDLSALDRGFEHYDFHTSDATNIGQRDAEATTDAALAWVRTLSGGRPYFMVVHYFDPHLTYDAPAPFDTMFEPDGGPRIERGFGSASQVFDIRSGKLRLDRRRKESLIARYDGELRFTDEQFGRLRQGLENLGRWDDALVVVVSDHGEEFWDHGGFEHGHSHHREMLQVPLLLRRPGTNHGQQRRERVRQLDIAPTILESAGSEYDDLPGRPLGGEGAGYSVAEGSLWAGDLVSVRSDKGTLVLGRDSGRVMFFTPGDTGELGPLEQEALAEPELLRILRALPAPRSPDREPRQLTEEQIEQLRSLGYIR